MLKSLLKGVSMGSGMGIGQELTSTVIQHFKDKKQGGQGDFGGQGGAAAHTQSFQQASARDIQCGRCNEINTGDSKFCGGCGNQLIYPCKLSSGVQCRCGFINAQGQKFCSECGNSLV